MVRLKVPEPEMSTTIRLVVVVVSVVVEDIVRGVEDNMGNDRKMMRLEKF